MTDKIEKERVKVADEDKVVPDKNEIICPLVLKVTGGKSAVNYDVTWLTTTQLSGSDSPGCWRSAPQNRGHSEAFYKELERMKEADLISADQNAFYFTHEQGIEAREKFEQLVLSGTVKANKKSWNNRFADFTGKTFEELTEEFSELYSTSTTTRSVDKEKQIVEEEKPQMADLNLDEIEPSQDDLHSMEEAARMDGDDEEEDHEVVEEGEPVAAATMTEPAVTEGETDLTMLRVPQEIEMERISSDGIVIRDGGDDIELFLFELPHNERLAYLPMGSITIDGYPYEVAREED